MAKQMLSAREFDKLFPNEEACDNYLIETAGRRAFIARVVALQRSIRSPR